MEIPKRQLMMQLQEVSILYLTSWSIRGTIKNVDIPISWSCVFQAATQGPLSDENMMRSPELVSTLLQLFLWLISYQVHDIITAQILHIPS